MIIKLQNYEVYDCSFYDYGYFHKIWSTLSSTLVPIRFRNQIYENFKKNQVWNVLWPAPDAEKNQQSGPEVVIVSILAAIVILGFIGIGLYILSVRRKDIDFCAR